MQILIIIIIILFIIYSFNNYQTEHAAFALDGLYLPDDPEQYDLFDIRSRYRGILGVKPNLLIDKNDQIKKITFSSPKPGLGETNCRLGECPVWFNNVYCWTCT